ncbi:hypothetical protein HMPREF3201_00952 [Megasphaera sp. MJR8396C]|nr:hypothetical protein HMPREF3201_00952 [Megasphaera sp. MJR8396C]
MGEFYVRGNFSCFIHQYHVTFGRNYLPDITLPADKKLPYLRPV